ncbi:MAG: DNA replication/repair protein RecF [Bacteroidota bacterium]
MHFSALQMSYFRNYLAQRLEFSPGINCLTGNNGAGKTNVLEAIHYLALTRGWSRNTEKYTLQERAPYFMVEGLLQTDDDASERIQCSYMPPKGKKMLVNKKPLARLSSHIGKIPLITVLPNDTQLIYGAPALRRKFMDSFISQYSPAYLQQLIRYDHALSQRNALIALLNEQGRRDPEQLELWDAQLVPAGRAIWQARHGFLTEFARIFLRYFHLIVSDKEQPEITLKSHLQENTAEEWQERLIQNRERDYHAQRTTQGIHKDDLVFTIDGQAVKNFGSQGQQKTFAIALKLAQYEILAARKGTAPILLLDDIFDKLDIYRLKAIAGILDDLVSGQVFVTDTTLERTQSVFAHVKQRTVRYFRVEDGTVGQV